MVGTTAAAFGGSQHGAHIEPLLIAACPASAPRAEEIALGIVVVAGLVPVAGAGRAGAQVAGPARRRDLRPADGPAAAGAGLAGAADGLVPHRQLEHRCCARSPTAPTSWRRASPRRSCSRWWRRRPRPGALHEHASEIASRALEFDKLPLQGRDDPAQPHRRPAHQRQPGAGAPVPAGGAALAHAGLRGQPGQHRRLRQRQGHRGAGLGGQAVRAAGPAAAGEGVPRDGAGHRGAALHAPRAPAAGHRRRRARRAVGHGDVRGSGRGAGGRGVQRARGGPPAAGAALPDGSAIVRGRRAHPRASTASWASSWRRPTTSPPWPGCAPSWRAASPTAARGWRPTTASCWWCSTPPCAWSAACGIPPPPPEEPIAEAGSAAETYGVAGNSASALEILRSDPSGFRARARARESCTSDVFRARLPCTCTNLQRGLRARHPYQAGAEGKEADTRPHVPRWLPSRRFDRCARA